MSRSIFCTTAENDGGEKAQRELRASKLWLVVPLKGEKYRHIKST